MQTEVVFSELPKSLLCVLLNAVEMGASDLHIVPDSSPFFRVNGELVCSDEFSHRLDKSTILLWVSKICQLLGLNHTETDLDFMLQMENNGRFRGHSFMHADGVSIVLRYISPILPSFSSIDAPPIFYKLIEEKQGLIVLTGATGSGKSTTLAAMINEMNNKQSRHIVCLEEPIEYRHQSNHCLIQQRHIGRHCVNFDDAIKHALRQDPDVILIGELRDRKSMKMALTAAETGHLVLATLHTQSAAGAISRFVDMFAGIEQEAVRAQLSQILSAAIWQQLVSVKDSASHLGTTRVAAFEVLLNNQAVANLIRQNKISQIQSIQQTQAVAGMQTMQQAVEKISQLYQPL